MLDRLVGHKYYCFLDGIHAIIRSLYPQKTKRKRCSHARMVRSHLGECPLGSRTFQRCMMAIFSVMVEKTIEVFMDILKTSLLIIVLRT